MAKELKFVILLDCYGELLTDKQRDYMEIYYCEDLSLSEISEHQVITRQAVRDVIKRSEQILLETEKKLGLAQKISAVRQCLENLKSVSAECSDKQISSAMNHYIDKCFELI